MLGYSLPLKGRAGDTPAGLSYAFLNISSTIQMAKPTAKMATPMAVKSAIYDMCSPLDKVFLGKMACARRVQPGVII